MTGPDLKPCPFCGGNNVRAFRHVPMQAEPSVMCRDCYASAVSVAKWNRRDPACEMVRQGHATDWPRYSGGHYRGCGE